MWHTHRFFTSSDVFSTLEKSREKNVQQRKYSAGFVDEILKMTVTAAVSIITAGALYEYALKPLWHIVKNS